ncbi:MAG: hypothetical protein U0640_13390 [Phycisphaerales bacterium]
MSSMKLWYIPVYVESFSDFVEKRNKRVKTQADLAVEYESKFGTVDLQDVQRRKQIQVERELGEWRVNRVIGAMDVGLNDGFIEIDVYYPEKTELRIDTRRTFRSEKKYPRARSIGSIGDDADRQKWLIANLKDLASQSFPTSWVDWLAVEVFVRATDWEALGKQSLEPRHV